MLTPRGVLASAHRRVRREDDEAGAVLVIFAVGLVGVMLFAAMAIDLGNIAQTKVHAETAAQDAALSAVADLTSLYQGGTDATNVEAQAVSDAESYLITNFSTLAGANFNGCAAAFPASVSAFSGADCFGFADPQNPMDNLSSPTTMAVSLPSRQVDYTFGRAGGLTSQAVGAVAYASISIANNSYLMPFAYQSGGGSGLQCLHTGSGRGAANCTGFTAGSGQFGLLGSPRYRIFLGSSSASGKADAVIGTNLVLGEDHTLQVAEPLAAEVCDAEGPPPNCPSYNDTAGAYDSANAVVPLTGVTLNSPAPALFTGGQTTPDGSCMLDPRLSHPDGFVASTSCAADNPYSGPTQQRPDQPWLTADTFGSSYKLNGVQISQYLNTTGETRTTGCDNDLPAGDGPGNTAIDRPNSTGTAWNTAPAGAPESYDKCLSDLMSSIAPSATSKASTAIFSAAIEQSPRFGIVPIVAGSMGKTEEQITGFAATYLDLAVGKNNNVDAISAWVFPLSMIDAAPTTGGSLATYLGGPPMIALCSIAAGNC